MSATDDLWATVRDGITRNGLIAPGDRIIVGVSGGADSLCLLHVLVRLRTEWDLVLTAATLDHMVRGDDSAADVRAVRAIAEAWSVPVVAGQADVPAWAARQQMGLEEAARRVRYAFLLRVARQTGAEAIAVGHQQDDQAETVLMHLIRGSGLDGLRGMLPESPLTPAQVNLEASITYDPVLAGEAVTPQLWPRVIRPLLGVSREMVDVYAGANDLPVRHDATNQDETYFRNRLRHGVLPLLETLNPNVRAGLARLADVAQGDAALVRQLGEARLSMLLRGEVDGVQALDRIGWGELSRAEQRAALRAAVRQIAPDLRDLGYQHIEDALDLVARGQTGQIAILPGGLALRLDYGVVQLGPLERLDAALLAGEAPALPEGHVSNGFRACDRVAWEFGRWQFTCAPFQADASTSRSVPAEVCDDPLTAVLWVSEEALLRLRVRQPGDRFAPLGMAGHSQKLSDTFINMRVPAARRDRTPLLMVDSEIAWLVVRSKDGLRSRIGQAFAGEELSNLGVNCA